MDFLYFNVLGFFCYSVWMKLIIGYCLLSIDWQQHYRCSIYLSFWAKRSRMNVMWWMKQNRMYVMTSWYRSTEEQWSKQPCPRQRRLFRRSCISHIIVYIVTDIHIHGKYNWFLKERRNWLMSDIERWESKDLFASKAFDMRIHHWCIPCHFGCRIPICHVDRSHVLS